MNFKEMIDSQFLFLKIGYCSCDETLFLFCALYFLVDKLILYSILIFFMFYFNCRITLFLENLYASLVLICSSLISFSKLNHYGSKGVEFNKLLVLQIICIGVLEMLYLPQRMSISIAI